MKRTFSLVLAALVALCLTACGSGQTQPQSSAEPQTPAEAVSGGWELPAVSEAVSLPQEVQEGFDKAAEQGLTPVALVAQQVVAGTNDLLLCTDGSGYQMVVLYRDLQGGAEVTNSTPFPVEEYTQSAEEAVPAEPLSGGWSAPEEVTALPLPEDAQTAFDKALAGFTGSDVEPMALLGTQVVAGMNYAILCRVTPVTPDPIPSVQVVTVYADLQDNASFTAFQMVDPADFNS